MQGATITKLVTSVTNKWAKVRKAEEREASRRWRRAERLYRPARTSLREIVYDNMEQAIENCSGGRGIEFPKRNLFYSMRKLVQDSGEADRELQWPYFQGLVDEYENEHGEIARMYRDPRGFLLEPHTERTIPLGTREVDGYEIPDLLFDKLLYVEKKGFLPIFQEFKVAEKYDMAIACAEGYATRAAKTLMANAEGSGVTLLAMHDADPDGYEIVRCLQEATRACDFGVDVIDLGLQLDEALGMGLEPENYYHRSGSGQRVELNDLAKDPEQFIQWVESKLAEHGLATKLIPPKKTIAKYAGEARREELEEVVEQHIGEIIDLETIKADLAGKFKKRIRVKDIPGSVEQWGEKLEPTPWRDQVKGMVKERLAEIDDGLEDAAKMAVRNVVLSKNK